MRCLIHYLRNGVLLRLDHVDIGFNLHLVGHCAYLQRHVHLGSLIHLETDALLGVGLESRSSHFKRIGADSQARKAVKAVRSSDCTVDRVG